MRFRARKLITLALAGAMTVQSTACGTLLYPERRGQTSGRIDPAVAIMDGLGLLLFIIPGVIAFAVDFSTGAIYLPGTGRRSDLDGTGDVDEISLRGTITAEELQTIIAAETGKHIDLSQAEVRKADGTTPDMLVALLNSGVKERPVIN